MKLFETKIKFTEFPKREPYPRRDRLNWAPAYNWAPLQLGAAQLGAAATGRRYNWAPLQLGAAQLGDATTGRRAWVLTQGVREDGLGTLLGI